jgi:hypothetical protein
MITFLYMTSITVYHSIPLGLSGSTNLFSHELNICIIEQI